MSKVNFKFLKLLSIFSVFLIVGYSNLGNAQGMGQQVPSVTVSKPVKNTISEYFEYSGKIKAIEVAEVRARVTGVIKKVKFAPGTEVKKGDKLFEIDKEPYFLSLNRAIARRDNLKADLELAATDLKRKENAFENKAISEISLIEAKTKYLKLKSDLMAAESDIKSAKLDLQYCDVLAEISGTISRNMVDRGNLVGPNQNSVLANIVNNSKVYVYFHLNERDLNSKFKLNNLKGSKIQLSLSNSNKFNIEGNIDYVGNKLDSESGSLELRGVVDNKDKTLISGMFAKIKLFKGEDKIALLVREDALGFDQQGSYLLAVNSKNIVEYKHVTTGKKVGNLIAIETGITENDKIIINGLQRVRPGAPVTPELSNNMALLSKKK